MGNFSRDPKARLTDAIAKHYVGVRMQQGVPVLDADWNELEDLRKHELQSLIKRFIGDGVPSGNDGFRIQALAGGGVGTIVLQAVFSGVGLSSLEIDFTASTAASILGFLPGRAYTQRFGSSPARLTGNVSGPFILADGMTLTVKANEEAGEVVTFAAADFGDISQATAIEVVAAINDVLARASAQVGAGNDFIIRGGDGTPDKAGRILVEGEEVLNETDFTYTSQPLFENSALAAQWGVPVVPALVGPAGSDRQDIVYIDVWEREVNADEDDQIVQPAIGIETAIRLKREWAIRVVPNATDLSGITRVAGHRYLILAKLDRKAADGDKINAESIVDLRKVNLNLAKHLKTPIHLQRGAVLLDATRFANIMTTLKTILLTRLQRRVFDFSFIDSYNQSLVQIAIQDIIQQSAFAAIQAQTGNFNNEDGLQFLKTLYAIQKEFVGAVDEFGNEGGNAQDFIDDYEKYLEGSPSDSIPGLKPALDTEDFFAAAVAQESINDFLSQPVNVLPEGSVIVSIKSVDPTSNLAFNVPFNITYEVESRVTSPQARESYNISFATVLPTTWEVSLNRNQIEVDAFGGRGTVVLTVTPRAGSLSVKFRLTATSARNPVINFTHESDAFQIGQPPPGEEFFQLVSPPLDGSGRIPFAQSDFSDGEVNFQLNLINTSDTDEQTFEVLHFVIPPVGQETVWHPIETEATPTQINLAAEQSRTDTYSIFGPVSPAIGTQGTLIAEATLIAVNGVTIADGKSKRLELTFIVVS